MNRPTDWRILKIVLAQFRIGSITRVTAEIEPKFRIQSEIFNRFVDLAMAADCNFICCLDSDFGLNTLKKCFARILDLGSIHFLEGGVGQRNPYEHECKISQPSLYIFC